MSKEASTPFPSADATRLVHSSGSSAQVVVPLVIDLLKPTSVVDFGCGTGSWLAAFRANGVTDVLGHEGGAVQQDAQIPADLIQQTDLSKPVTPARRYDLAMSVEVGEHLPASAADTFVETLSAHSDAIFFSAATPGQGGQWHINEQWPAYWYNRFVQHGFECFDILRPMIWGNRDVTWWYQQNVLIYARGDVKRSLEESGYVGREPMDLVHPGMLEKFTRYPLLPPIARTAVHAVRDRVGRLRG